VNLAERLRQEPYEQYAYAYPHKTAYRELPSPVDLATLWAGEDRRALFGYVHVPFCSHRCGFCNLFALGRPGEDLVEQYVAQLERQVTVVGAALGEHAFARFALGGGTPSFLTASQLARVFEAVHRHWRIDLRRIPAGIEVSPETATPDRLALCRDAGIDRVSMGVQSFVDTELAALVRPNAPSQARTAIEHIRAAGFPTLNLDLIYGIEGQSAASLRHSVSAALEHQPEEIYLYPLYVRPRTGLSKLKRPVSTDSRPALYAQARDLLLAAGYTQVSMRMFRAPHAPDAGGPAYCCQNDGMVGVGCGARSYTRTLHYSDRFGVARTSVADILREYASREPRRFAQAYHGFALDAHEQRRRFVIQSLLVWPGLEERQYRSRFGSDLWTDLPNLAELLDHGLARSEKGLLALTEAGMALADTIGPWLASDAVTSRMRAYALA
jgi:oxygen-independent coproporphyrinogen-3 oxidase